MTHAQIATKVHKNFTKVLENYQEGLICHLEFVRHVRKIGTWGEIQMIGMVCDEAHHEDCINGCK